MREARAGTTEMLALAGVLAATAVVVSLGIARGAPFEYDEAAYAIEGRAWVDGGATPSFGIQHAPGLPAIAALVYAAGGRSEVPFRLVGLVSALALVAATWMLGRRVGSRHTGAFAAALVATWPAMVERGTQLLTDVGAAACIVAVAAVLWREAFQRERPGWGITWIAPLAGAAFALRYGSALPLGLVGLTVVAMRPRLALDRIARVASALSIVAVLPTLLYATGPFGAPWRVFTEGARMAGRAHLGEGLVDYARMIGTWQGSAAVIAAVVGLAACVARRDRAAVFLGVPATAHVLLLGVFVHGEARFVFPSVALLCVAAAREVGERLAASRGIAVAAIAALAGLAAGAAVTTSARLDSVAASRVVVVDAARELRRVAGPGPCEAVSIQAPVMSWYSGCVVGNRASPPPASRYVVGFARDDASPGAMPGPAVARVVDRSGRFGDAAIYRLP